MMEKKGIDLFSYIENIDQQNEIESNKYIKDIFDPMYILDEEFE